MFYAFGFLAVVGAFVTVLHPRAVNSAMSLVMVMVSLAGIYLLLNAHLVAVLQVIVYAGAIMVLILFVIMLLGEDEKLAHRSRRTLLLQLALVVVVSAVFLVMAASLKRESMLIANPDAVTGVVSTDPQSLGEQALTQSGAQNPPAEFGTVKAVGRILFTRYVLAFEVVSLVLLAAVVGAVLLAKRRLNP